MRKRNDRGAVLVETSLVIPILMLIVSGITVLGFGWKDKMTTETASRAAARTITNLGTDSQADYSALKTVLSGLSDIPTSNIQRIVIFNANSTNTVPSACLSGTAGQSGVCNVYTSSSFSLPTTSFGCSGTSPDRYWCPTSRISSQSATNGPDYVGIYVSITAPYVSNMMGVQIQMVQSTVVMRIEAT